MKTLLCLTLGALVACPIFANAQSTGSTTPSGPPPGGGPGGGHHMDFLTPDQQAEIEKDREAVFQSDPDLATKIQGVHEQMEQAHESGQPPSKDLMDQMKTLQDQLFAAILKIDPAAAPIIAEIKAHHRHHGPGGPGGQGGPDSQGGNTPPPAGNGT